MPIIIIGVGLGGGLFAYFLFMYLWFFFPWLEAFPHLETLLSVDKTEAFISQVLALPVGKLRLLLVQSVGFFL